MSRTVPLLLLALLSQLAAAPAAGAQQTSVVRVELRHGAVVGVANLLTGDIYTREVGAAGVESLLRFCDDAGGIRDLREGEDGAVLRTEAIPDGADVAVRQTGRRADGGVSGVWLGLGPLDAEKITLLVPGVGGVSLGPDSAVADCTYHYPGAWGTPALIVQGADGGVLISADDPAQSFKALRVTRLRTAWRVGLLTLADPPWPGRTECRSARWRFTAYRGPWTVAAATQRAKVRRAFGLTPLAERRPKWIDSIRCLVRVVGGGPVEGPLRALAARVEPRKTLLYVPHWRTHPYDVMYPDYTPSDHALTLIELAHELRFRVMAHGNLVGISPFHPRIEEFRDAIERDPGTHGPVGWYLDRDTKGQIYCLNPAFAKVRKLLVDAFAGSHKQAGFDALHLDFPVVVNSDTGPVEGMNSIHGTVRLLHELQAALPGVPLGTEGISDFMLDCSWAQLGEPFWNDRESMGRYHPVRAAVFSEFCSIYGHLGIPNQQTDLQAYLSFIEVHDRTGCLPTFTLDLDNGLDLDAPGTRYALRQARFFLARDPIPDYATVLEPVGVPDDAPAVPYFAWRLADGGSLAVVQTREGRKWITRQPGEAWRELWRVYQGVHELSGPVHVPGWLAYSGERSFGLDPGAVYLPLDGPPEPSSFHVASASVPVRMVLCGREPRRDIARLESVQPSVTDLSDIRPDVTGLMVEGEQLPMGKGGSFAPGSFTSGGIALKGVWAHPPYRFPRLEAGEHSPDFRPAAFGEYRLRLPDEDGLRFRAELGLRDLPTPETPTGDGVTFRVRVDDVEVLERHWAERRWEPVEVDLSPWRGKYVRLALVTDVGPAGRADFDWALWGQPRVVPQPLAGSATVELRQPNHEGVLVVADETGTRLLDPAISRVDVALPAGFVYARSVTEVTGPCELVALPYTTCLVSGAVTTPGSLFGAGAPCHWSGGDPPVPGINGHTPSWGQTHLEWLLRLPEDPLKLAFGAAIQPGGERMAFRVLLNGRGAWDGGDPGTGKMAEGAIDLSPWAGQVALVSLVTDSLGSNNCDWAVWVAPRLVAR